MTDRIPEKPPGGPARRGVDRAARAKPHHLPRLACRLLAEIRHPSAERPHLDHDVGHLPLLAGGEALVAVGENEAPPQSNDGQRRKERTAVHRVAIFSHLVGTMGLIQQIDDLTGRDDENREGRFAAIEPVGIVTRTRRVGHSRGNCAIAHATESRPARDAAFSSPSRNSDNASAAHSRSGNHAAGHAPTTPALPSETVKPSSSQ